MSSLSNEDIREETDAATKDSSEKGEVLENEKLHQDSRPISESANVDNFELATICKELFKLSLLGAAEKSQQDVISTMTESLKRWLNGQINANNETSTCKSNIDKMDGAVSTTSLKNYFLKNSIAPRRWLVRFFVNNHILKDATFIGCDETDKGIWQVNELEPRFGIEADIKNAEFVFKEILSCEWESVVQRDKNAKEILSMLKELAMNWSHREYDGLICFFSSHGTEGHILGSDGQLLSISDICTSLNSIADPKLLFIQACQGSKKNRGIVSTSVKEISKNSTKTFPLSNISNSPAEVEESDAISERLVTPMDHNFLIYFATTSQYESYRNSKYGSIMFIFLFYEIIKAHADKESDFIDIYDLLTQVNKDMKNFKAKNESKQMPVFVNTLTKRVKLLTRNEMKNLEDKLEQIIPPDFYLNGYVD